MADIFSNPRFWLAVAAFAASLGGNVVGVSQHANRGDGYEAAFNLCRELALENRKAGFQKIIPLVPQNIVEAVEESPAKVEVTEPIELREQPKAEGGT